MVGHGAAVGTAIGAVIGVFTIMGYVGSYFHIPFLVPTPPSQPPPPTTDLIACFKVTPTDPNGGNTVKLDGSCSRTDPNGLIMSWSWKQIHGLHGHKVPLSNNEVTTFTAPHVSSPTALRFLLTVTDNHNRKSSEFNDVVFR